MQSRGKDSHREGMLHIWNFITKLGKHTFIVKLVIEETFSNISYPKLIIIESYRTLLKYC